MAMTEAGSLLFSHERVCFLFVCGINIRQTIPMTLDQCRIVMIRSTIRIINSRKTQKFDTPFP